jgi:hypothetical protein
MKWCLDCHRHPEKYVRPRAQVFSMTWSPEDENTTQAELGPRLVEKYHINPAPLDDEGKPITGSHGNKLINCSTCHR